MRSRLQLDQPQSGKAPSGECLRGKVKAGIGVIASKTL